MFAIIAVIAVITLGLGAIALVALGDPAPSVGDTVRIEGDSRLWRVERVEDERVTLRDLASRRSSTVTVPAERVVREPLPIAPPNA